MEKLTFLTIFNYRVLSILSLGLIFLLFQNCGTGFEATSLSSETISKTIEGDSVAFEKFVKVIDKHCTHCHGAADSNFGGIVNFANLRTQESWIKHASGLIQPKDFINSKIYNRLALAKNEVGSLNANMPFAIEGKPVSMTMAEAFIIKAYIMSIKGSGPVSQECEGEIELAQTDLRRLNKDELSNSINDVFSVPGGYKDLPEPFAGQFNNIPKFQSIDELFFERLLIETDLIAESISMKDSSQYDNCNNSVSCISKMIEPKAELLFRKELNSEDKEIYLRSMNKVSRTNVVEITNKDIYKAGIMSILLHPNFLFTIRSGSESGERKYSEFEIASKLAITFLKSVPDRALWLDAKNKRISNNYDSVINRLLSSDLFRERFSKTFLEGWLSVNKIDSFDPSFANYGLPTAKFNRVKESIKESVSLGFKDFLSRNQSVEQLATGSVRFLDKTLQDHFAINAQVPEQGFARITLQNESPYSQSGFIAYTPTITTSLSDRESIVQRGVNIMGAFTCKSTPPPPEDVVGEIDFEDFKVGTPQREILASHSKDVRCASCHSKFDPYGFGLELFDGTGRFRTKDSFGNLLSGASEIGGSKFSNHKEMARYIASEDRISNCMIQLSFTYATDKSFDVVNSKEDFCSIQKVDSKIGAKTKSMKEILREVAKSKSFLYWSDNESE